MSAAEDPLRWEQLFTDLETQAAAFAAGELEAEVAERTRIETAQLDLAGRLRSAGSAPVRVSCVGPLRLSGTVTQIGSEWILLDEGAGREALVASARIISVAGLGRLSTAVDGVDQVTFRLGLQHALRGIARDRSPVQAHLIDSSVIHGTLDRVGSDFIELALHLPGEQRRPTAVHEVSTIAHSAIVALRRDI